jgi:uncharacterized membrane protein YdjX (TVP38/TMEM64 family)
MSSVAPCASPDPSDQPESHPPTTIGSRPGISRKHLLLIGLAVAAVAALVWLLPTVRWITAALSWMQALGPWGVIAFIGVYVVLSIVALPTSLMNLGAGVLYGVLGGFVVSLAAATTSNVLCFFVARHVARDWVIRRLRCNPKHAALLNGLRDGSWKVILLTRLNPLLPSAVAGYCFGVTPVRFRTYLWASVVGNAPLCFLMAYFGYAGHRAILYGASTLTYVLWGLGLVSTIGLGVWATRYTGRKLKQYQEQPQAGRQMPDPVEPGPRE